MMKDSLPLGRGGHPAGQAGDDAVLEHVELQAGLAVSVVALEDLNTQNIRICPQSPLPCDHLRYPLFVVVAQQAGVAGVYGLPGRHLQANYLISHGL